MNKKIVIGLITAILVAAIGVGVFFALRNNNQDENGDNTDNSSSVEDSNSTSSNANNGGNMLVVYFSAQGHTEEVANQIANNLGADTFEITPVQEYTSDDLDWTNDSSRVSREHNDEYSVATHPGCARHHLLRLHSAQVCPPTVLKYSIS